MNNSLHNNLNKVCTLPFNGFVLIIKTMSAFGVLLLSYIGCRVFIAETDMMAKIKTLAIFTGCNCVIVTMYYFFRFMAMSTLKMVGFVFPSKEANSTAEEIRTEDTHLISGWFPQKYIHG